MFLLTFQTSDREPASRHTFSLNVTVLNSPLCLLYPSWHPFSSLEPKTALHYKMQQQCKTNNLSKLETFHYFTVFIQVRSFYYFWLALTSDWQLSAAESGWNRRHPCLSLTQTNTTPTSFSDCPEIHLQQIQLKQACINSSGATEYQFPPGTSLCHTYIEFFHWVLNSFPQHPGIVTHQISDMKTLAQGHKLGVFVSVSRGRRW